MSVLPAGQVADLSSSNLKSSALKNFTVCTGGVALNHALGGGHLGAVGVGEVALELLPLGVQALGRPGDEVASGLRFALQLLDSGLALGVELGVAVFVLGLLRRDDPGRGLVQASGPVGQLGVGAAALFAGVGRQLHAVDGEHGLADQPQAARRS